MHSVCRCSLLVWRRSFLKKGSPVTYFCPTLDPPLGGSGRKTTTLVKDHKYFMHTKFHQNPSSSSWEEVENVKVYGRRTTDGRQTTTDKRTDDWRCAMTIAHLSLRLRWAKIAIGGRRWDVAAQERKVCSIEIKIVTLVVKGSVKLTVPTDW